MKAHYEKMLLDTDERVKQSLKAQVRTPGETFGGFQDKNGIIHAKYTIYRVTSAIAAFCNHESCYYRDETVFRLICDGLSYVASQQHENGLFDLVSCNFFSAPDTTFCVKRMMPYLRFLQKEQGDAQNAEIYRALYAIAVQNGSSMVLKAGTVTMGNAEECLHIGPGFGTHLYTAGKFGSEARSPYAYTLYCTDATPFEHEITLTSENRSIYSEV